MTAQSQPFAPDGPALSADDFANIARFISNEAGLCLPETNQPLVYSRLVRHVHRLGCADFSQYLKAVHADDSGQERETLIQALTTNTTRFFREPAHFDILARDLLPELVARARKGGRVRIWSAGCSTGEEAYCIAAVVLSQFPEVERSDLRILGTDINHSVLERAKKGEYSSNHIAGIPDAYVDQMFEPADGATEVRSIRPALKNMISFRYLNLIAPWPVRGPFDAIFCRNVAIYMDQPTQHKLWAGFERVLSPNGMLFIGHSERLGPEMSQRFRPTGQTAFCRVPSPGHQLQGETHVS